MSRPDVVAAARAWIGTPYRHQASLKGVGCDCLGLLRGVWRDIHGPEPEAAPAYAADWAEAGGAETLLGAAERHLLRIADETFIGDNTWRPGDVLLFRWRPQVPAKHCAIAGSPDTMIHAHEGAAVSEVAVAPWWGRHLCAVFRFPEGDR